jgi:hypothetical protein
MGIQIRITEMAPRPVDPKVSRPVVDKAKRIMEWLPIMNLEEGLCNGHSVLHVINVRDDTYS